MEILRVRSIARINTIYGTGERPVLIECDDLKSYVAKYMKSSAAAYKLVCELCGSMFAHCWKLNTPDIAFVDIRPADWLHYGSINFTAPAFGSRKLLNVIDLTSISLCSIRRTKDIYIQLLKIALFDIWIANEDRNNNNYNLLYDLLNSELIVLDHGCIFNTATFDYELSLLTCNETILDSELAHILSVDLSDEDMEILHDYYNRSVDKCKSIVLNIENYMPKEWNVRMQVVRDKLQQLFKDEWVNACWNTFLEYL